VNRKLFGTDGVRGIANKELTPELAFQIAQAAALLIIQSGWTKRVVIGQDTRLSSPMLEAAVCSGFCSLGVDVTSLGIVPTGCVSYIARTSEYGMGIMISASHNPALDNGIKLIAHDGRKLRDETELEIENLISDLSKERPIGGSIGRLDRNREEVQGYLKYLKSIVPERLDGMHLALDLAHGAAYELAIELFEQLGATVYIIGGAPDGMNINHQVGATHPAMIQDFTKETGAELGICFDGDADRVVFSDEQGRLINGDRAMAIWSIYWHQNQSLSPAMVVGTVMSNGGFEGYLKSHGIELERANVGDKYVSQILDKKNACIGGEQSGHIIFPKRGPTGDGLITALEILRVLKCSNRRMSSYYQDFDSWPQILINVQVQSKQSWDQSPEVQKALQEASLKLQKKGRILVRPSGTQPYIRVMVEADNNKDRDVCANEVVAAICSVAGGKVSSSVDLTYALGE